MELGSLRLLARAASMSVTGVDAVVTTPGGAPVSTRVLWVQSVAEDYPLGHDFQRREPRRIVILSRADVPDVPRGTVIAASEYAGATSRSWIVDNIDREDADEVRAIVTPTD